MNRKEKVEEDSEQHENVVVEQEDKLLDNNDLNGSDEVREERIKEIEEEIKELKEDDDVEDDEEDEISDKRITYEKLITAFKSIEIRLQKIESTLYRLNI